MSQRRALVRLAREMRGRGLTVATCGNLSVRDGRGMLITPTRTDAAALRPRHVVAAILDVPFVLAIGVLVFLGGFIPLVGATISGSVAVLVALVDEGAIVALIMLGGVIAVQQLEAHVLQPFLLGRMVSIHPLAIIVSIASGAYFAGIAGALVAVPLVASLNAVAVYLSSTPEPPEEMEEDVAEETGEGVTPGPEPGSGPRR